MDLKKMLEEVRKSEVSKVEKKQEKSEKTSFKKDERLLSLSSGNTYRMRLLYYVPKNSNRKSPFINKFVHSFWDDAATDGNKSHWVTCPTSEYIDDLNGFKKCPICNANSKFYKDYLDNKSTTSKSLYDLFKRKFYGFALVYVVNDPTTPENNGQIKILKYTKTLNDYLKLKIFGIKKAEKGKIIILDPDDESVIGSDAFDLKAGSDLIITVNQKEVKDGEKKIIYPDYSFEFSTRKLTPVPITIEDIEKAVKNLKFDEDFYSISSQFDLTSFYKKYVLKESIEEEEENEPEEKVETIIEQDDEEVEKTPNSKIDTSIDDDINIDDVLNNILNSVKG